MPLSPEDPNDFRGRSFSKEDPAYSSHLTDPMMEIDRIFESLREVCERYKLDHISVITHMTGDACKAQILSRAYSPKGATALLISLDEEVSNLTDGHLRIVDISEDGPDEPDEDDDEDPPTMRRPE